MLSNTVNPSDHLKFAELSTGQFAIGLITLNNPRALNALTLPMFQGLESKLLQWRERSEIACVVLHAESAKAFCAGGDVKALVNEITNSATLDTAAAFFSYEYFVDYLIHVYPKPILCWADGIIMGGGIGIMNGASCRVVTERTMMAMPEMAIGLFPDVGGSYFLNRMPAGCGLFLGLTSARFDGQDAVAIGMADFIVDSKNKAAVFDGLTGLDWAASSIINRRKLNDYVARFAKAADQRSSALMGRQETVNYLTRHPDIHAVDRAMRAWRGDDEWIKLAIQSYCAGSPNSPRPPTSAAQP